MGLGGGVIGHAPAAKFNWGERPSDLTRDTQETLMLTLELPERESPNDTTTAGGPVFSSEAPVRGVAMVVAALMSVGCLRRRGLAGPLSACLLGCGGEGRG